MRMIINKELEEFAERNIDPKPHIETCQVDLSVGDVWFMTSKQEPKLFVDSRLTADVIPYYPENNVWTLQPYAPYQITTAETVNIPPDVYMHITPRRTTFASGLCVFLTDAKPGYKGKLSFTVVFMLGSAEARNRIHIEKGFRIISATFEKLAQPVQGYNGFWQGGRPEGTGSTPGSPT